MGVLDQAVGHIGGGESLPRARGHLDEGLRPGEPERLLKIDDGGVLLGPQTIGRERYLTEVTSERLVLLDHLEERVGPVEREDVAAAGVGFHPVRELGHLARGFVLKRKRAPPRGQRLRQALAVTRGLTLDAFERVPDGLGLDDAERLPSTYKGNPPARANRETR
ncbi:MAG: hypothetical protein IPM33_10665 [Phycisphaerales bacterium]|nr:hypothetical protein [Phycisphaerales bacterium]